MIVGVPKEVKNNENRVGITPSGAASLIKSGHTVLIEKDAGQGSGISDESYVSVGAAVVESAPGIWHDADMIIKVKEPQPSEYEYFRKGKILFTYLHLAAEQQLTRALVNSGIAAIGYETVQQGRSLPLLSPMSEIAGRMSVQIGSQFLERNYGGKGVLLGGIPGVKRGKVTIIGGGVAGTNAAMIAVGLGAEVTVIDRDLLRLRELDNMFGRDINTLASNELNIAEAVRDSDLVVGAVLIPGAKAPKLVTEKMVKEMKQGSVLVDIAIDQGGIFETSDRVTTHDDPVYQRHGVLHYAVANMPGSVPQTSTLGLTNATMPYVLEIANKGLWQTAKDNAALAKGINIVEGDVVHEVVAGSLGYHYTPLNDKWIR